MAGPRFINATKSLLPCLTIKCATHVGTNYPSYHLIFALENGLLPSSGAGTEKHKRPPLLLLFCLTFALPMLVARHIFEQHQAYSLKTKTRFKPAKPTFSYHSS